MNKTEIVRARIDPALKMKAEHVLDEMGISPTQAIKMLYKELARSGVWPFELKIPNEETLKTFEETDKGKGLNKAKNAQDLFNQLGI